MTVPDIKSPTDGRSPPAPVTLLDKLRTRTNVDCDTLDVEVAKSLGPFTSVTSNQAIALSELLKTHPDSTERVHQELIERSIRCARQLHAASATSTEAAAAAEGGGNGNGGGEKFPTTEELAVELMMVALAGSFAPYVTGYCHVQTNPRWAYSTERMVANAERLIAHIPLILPPSSAPSPSPLPNLCIKIPSTHPGLLAIAHLSSSRSPNPIPTLATTTFAPAQATLAAQAGALFIAPYVHRLARHFPGGEKLHDDDPAEAMRFVRSARTEFAVQQKKKKGGTRKMPKVMAASLCALPELVGLADAGAVDHITVPPRLLREMADTPAGEWDAIAAEAAAATGMLQGGAEEAPPPPPPAWNWGGEEMLGAGEEWKWRLEFSCSRRGRDEARNAEAIAIFVECQEGLEGLVRTVMAEMDARGGVGGV